MFVSLQDHTERDEGVPARREDRPLPDDQARERQAQRAQPTEVQLFLASHNYFNH